MEDEIAKSELVLKDPIAVASNKIYKKIANNKITSPQIVVQEPSDSSFFTAKYSVFGYEMSLYFILILIVVLFAIFYYIGNYFEWFGKSNIGVKNDDSKKIVKEKLEPVEEEEEEDEAENEEEVEEEEVCDLKKK